MRKGSTCNLAQRRKIAGICALFKAYIGERAWKFIGNRLKGPCYLSRDDHDRKFRARKQRKAIGNNSFVNGAITLWNQLATALVNGAIKLWNQLATALVNHVFLESGLGK
jgi:hypothetical protein